MDPGLTRWRGKILQDLIVTWLDLAKQDVMIGAISKEAFKKRVALAMEATSMAFACLKFDPKNDE